MEDCGIKPVFLGTYFVFVCSLIPIGFAENFATLVVVRFFSGGCVQLLSNAVAGVISNVFRDDRERSVPISLYITTYLVSTSMGPVIGSTILQYLDWRWIGHIELIWTAAFFPLHIPSSRKSRIGYFTFQSEIITERRKRAYTAEEFQKKPIHQILIRSVQRPLYMLFTESVVFIATLWAAFRLGTIYLFTQSVEQVYSQIYDWNSLQAGYVQLAIAIGECIGCALCMYTNSWYYDSAARNTEVPGTPIPEARLYPSVIGGFLGVTGGVFLYGWTSISTMHWIIPTLGLSLGCGTSAIIISNANYLVDAYSKYAASALGVVGLVENVALAFIPLASSSMYTDLKFQWASSLLAFLSLALVVTPFAVFI
ncbi:971289da-7457-422a-a30c-57c66ca54558 [Sclerotinia trifoliorum]|uniref:971289da-7457-422a-a30c-57c66ca54558 n=1 Tax=Sclerotinia trifoliorum TaxID=28548 RepID=A0A8H2VT90_9HELO|nr:971289da-7457-422a-a30c-57c66ca54558 [Sclerotinia trifoliorum]